MISVDKLKEFLELRNETPKIEFKLKYDLRGQNSAKVKDELAKDLLALTNTAGRSRDDAAYLIIGAGDTLKTNGTRDAHDVRPSGFSAEQFLQIVNARCNPSLQNLEYAEIELNGNFYGVVEIPPSPLLHELSRNLDTPSGGPWRQGSIVVRHGSEVGVASFNELKLMEREKESWSGQAAHGKTPLELLEEYLPDPAKKIVTRKLILTEAQRLNTILNSPEFFAKDENLNLKQLNERMAEYENLTETLLGLFAAAAYYGDDWINPILVEALTVVGDVNHYGRNSNTYLNLRRYPALLLFYTSGVAAVASDHNSLLASLFHKVQIRRWGTLSDPAQYLPPGTVLGYGDENYLEEARHHQMPFEAHLHEFLKKPLTALMHSLDKYLDSFARFEYLFVLNSLKKGVGVIRGSYMWHSELRRKNASYSLIPVIRDSNNEIENNGSEWLPFKSGIFAGSWEEFMKFKTEADQKISEMSEYYITTDGR